MLNALLNLDKPVGPTSFHIVNRLRRLTGVRKIGHTGTLDPLAGGVLPICLGRAVRLSEYLLSDDKVYQAEITFGIRTSTDDGEGEVVARQEVNLSRAQVESALIAFVGDQMQVPPQYAAIKVAGTPMYALARRGKTVDAAPRRVHIERLTLLDWQPPRASAEIECGKGTYIRALARDLGEKLGCGAFLSALTRTRCGVFTLSEAVTLETLESASDWRTYLLPMDYGLKNWAQVRLSAEETRRVLNGLTVALPQAASTQSLIRAYNQEGRFFAILRADAAQNVLRPEKVFQDTGDGDPAR